MAMYKYLFDNDRNAPNIHTGYIYKNEQITKDEVRGHVLEIDIANVMSKLNLDKAQALITVEAVVKSIYRMNMTTHPIK